jgi:hypothetical protein
MDVVIVLDPSKQPDITLHAHEFSELVIITGGHGTHFTQTGNYPVSTGDVFVIDPGLGHGYRDTHNLTLKNILFNFDRLNVPWSTSSNRLGSMPSSGLNRTTARNMTLRAGSNSIRNNCSP